MRLIRVDYRSHRFDSAANKHVCSAVNNASRWIAFTAVSKIPAYITLSGASLTKALPAGPALPLKAVVTQNGVAAPRKYVTVRLSDGQTFSGSTDTAGALHFQYTPPYFLKTSVQIQATCTDCSNTARKTITVDACDVCEGSVGDPIQPGTAEELQTDTDWQDLSAHSLSLVRNYRSFGTVAAAMGHNWSHRFSGSVTVSDDGTDATVRLGNGNKVFFHLNAAGTWQPQNSADSLHPDTTGGWVYRQAADDTLFTFDAKRLLSITARNGWRYQLTYNNAHQLLAVTNAFSRSLSFSYSSPHTDAVVTAVTTPEGRQIRYGYDNAGNLQTVTLPDGSSKHYLYENTAWPHALTGIVDPSGTRLATIAYDDIGRAISTIDAAGSLSYHIRYPSPNRIGLQGLLSAAGHTDPAWYTATVTLINPLGQPRGLGSKRIKEGHR